MSLRTTVILTAPVWIVLYGVLPMWQSRRYIAAWAAWRASRPALGDYRTRDDFVLALENWRNRKPVKRYRERA